MRNPFRSVLNLAVAIAATLALAPVVVSPQTAYARGGGGRGGPPQGGGSGGGGGGSASRLNTTIVGGSTGRMSPPRSGATTTTITIAVCETIDNGTAYLFLCPILTDGSTTSLNIL